MKKNKISWFKPNIGKEELKQISIKKIYKKTLKIKNYRCIINFNSYLKKLIFKNQSVMNKLLYK